MLLQITQTTAAALDTVAQAASGLPAVSAPPAGEQTLSLFELVVKGGPLMIPIGLLSLISIYVLVERYIAIRKASSIDAGFMSSVKDLVENGNLDAAKALCKNSATPIARMIEKGISRIGKPIREIESAIENIGRLEVSTLERKLNILGIIAGIAPMFGFIGTIMGVIKIFYNISLADNISIGLIAGGLYEKMITSASGLVVGVVAFIGYHYLNMMLDKLVGRVEAHAIEFIDILEQPTR